LIVTYQISVTHIDTIYNNIIICGAYEMLYHQ